MRPPHDARFYTTANRRVPRPWPARAILRATSCSSAIPSISSKQEKQVVREQPLEHVPGLELLELAHKSVREKFVLIVGTLELHQFQGDLERVRTRDELLIVCADNISPDGQESPAIEVQLSRA